jgi:hypothetical protein
MDKISVLDNSVDIHTTSNPSRMSYYVMFPHWMSVMFFWEIHICGNTMLFMSLDPTVSLFLWGVISKELLYHRSPSKIQKTKYIYLGRFA